jgi:hypothetical protein
VSGVTPTTGAIHHVSLETAPSDADSCARFFELLGFVRVTPPAALKERTVWLSLESQQIHLLFTDVPANPPFGHIAVTLDDFAGALERLRSGGFSIEPNPDPWRCLCRDAAGHRVEIIARRHAP